MISVEYLRHMGDDLAVADAARVSFAKQSSLNEDGTLRDADKRLINTLAREQHKSPFNHCFITFRVKAPIFVARQLVKHEYLPWNEVSRRYVEGDLAWYWPDATDWRSQPKDVKQGSGEALPESYVDTLEVKYLDLLRTAEALYEESIELGLCREQARMFLPQSLMTEWIWSGSLYAFAKMVQLRTGAHAQHEARYVAELIEAEMIRFFETSMTKLKEHGAA